MFFPRWEQTLCRAMEEKSSPWRWLQPATWWQTEIFERACCNERNVTTSQKVQTKMSPVYVKRLCPLPLALASHSSAFVSSRRSGEEGEVGVIGWSRFVVFVFCSSDLSESAASTLRTESEWDSARDSLLFRPVKIYLQIYLSSSWSSSLTKLKTNLVQINFQY